MLFIIFLSGCQASDAPAYDMSYASETATAAELQESGETQPLSPSPDGEDAPAYIGNVHSKKLHIPSCHTLPAEENRVSFDSAEEAHRQGYEDCGNCLPANPDGS